MYFSDQSDFIEVVSTEEETKKVSEVNFYIDEGFTQKVYDSCKDVVNPSLTGSVMDLMCGAWGSNLCTPSRETIWTFSVTVHGGEASFLPSSKYCLGLFTIYCLGHR